MEQITIPSSIQGIIIARIDKLQSGLKDILHAAAVIGPVFKHALIKRVIKVIDIDERLGQLVDMGLIFESKSFPEIEYSFRNVLIQEAVYSTLLHKKLKELHATVAREIETLYEGHLEDYFEALAQHYQSASDQERAYHYLLKSGLKAKETYANQDAANYFQQAIDLAKDMANPPLNFEEVFMAISEVKEFLGDMDAAIEALQTAITLIENEVQKADTLRNIGRIHEKRGFNEKAIDIYEEAFQLLKDHPDTVEMGMVYMNQSWVLNRMRQHEEAVEKAKLALNIFESHDAKEKSALVYNNLAVIFEHKGDLEKAFQYNQKSLDLFSELGNKRQIANLFLSLGFMYNKKNDFKTALDYFEKSLEIMNHIGNRFGSGTALMSKGRCYIDLEKLDEAESALVQALHLHRELDLKRKIVANELALGNVYTSKGDAAAAREHIKKARIVATEQKYISDLAKSARMEAHVLIKEGKEPNHKFQEAIDLFKSIGRTQDIASITEELNRFSQTGQIAGNRN